MAAQSATDRRLYPHQRVAVDRLTSRRRFGLFDDQGLGKTCTALVAAFEATLGTGTGAAVLVVCPAGVLWNWARECRAWLGVDPTVIDSSASVPQDAGPIVCTTHTLLLSEDVAAFVDRPWGVLIVDEAHEFRTPTAKRTRALYGSIVREGLIDRAEHAWMLTGTPTPNNPSEIYSFLAGAFPERLVVAAVSTRSAFVARFCRVRETRYGSKIIGAKNVVELRALLAGTYLRRLKGDVLDLPPVRVEHETVGSLEDAEVVRAYEAVRGIRKGDLLDRDAFEYAEWRRLCGLCKAAPAADLIRSTPGPVVVFAHHLQVLDELEAALGHVFRIDGSTPKRKRDDMVARFQAGEGRIVLAQNRAGGVGITLTRAAEVVLVEPSFVPGDNAQMIDRTVRIGQVRSVRVRFLSLARSVDEDVVEALRVKSEMIRQTIGATT